MRIFNGENEPFLLTTEAFEIYSQCMYKPSVEEYKKEITALESNAENRIFICTYQDFAGGMEVHFGQFLRLHKELNREIELKMLIIDEIRLRYLQKIN